MDDTNNGQEGIIRLYDGWVILVDDRQWTLARETGRIRKDTGKPYYNVRGYYTRLATALKALYEANIHSRLQNGTADLRTALQTIEEEHDRMQKFISENIPNV